ncbi:glycosyl transferase family protein [Anopheles sinensis]|uniref:Glycosyl transferase family protein n=1 Tax=Anopheles sinensis TaxID=74873 RepID=A0A084WSQ1_ANOSI|nr:glycosyl transferase family protein [Anopheles sinensis]
MLDKNNYRAIEHKVKRHAPNAEGHREAAWLPCSSSVVISRCSVAGASDRPGPRSLRTAMLQCAKIACSSCTCVRYLCVGIRGPSVIDSEAARTGPFECQSSESVGWDWKLPEADSGTAVSSVK